ncbi:MAG: NAD(P)H-binding protein [Vicinamibacterales bacterium]
MKVLILGATGGTGRQLVAQARSAGHEVTAFDRHAGTALADAMAGRDAVISAIGRGKSFTSHNVIAQSVPVILSAMKAAGVRRLIFMSALGVGESFRDSPILAKLFFRTLLRGIYADKAIGDQLIRGSDLDWTIVQPSQLTDGPLTGTYRFGERLKMSGMPQISRADTAQFIVRQLGDPANVRKTPIISY